MDVDLPTLVTDLFADLLAAPSENPPGDERAVATVVRKALDGAGFAVTEPAREAHRPNVVGTLRRGEGRKLILQAHADTKPAGPVELWDTDPWLATARDGRLHGLGACDTKGGLAAQLACAVAMAADRDWTGELVLQAVADEEDGSWYGAEYLLELGLLTADAAIVAEPTSCAPSFAQLGNAWAEVTIDGAGAHAGRPERGHDAFAGATRYLAELDRLVNRLPRDPMFPGHPRVNVGDVLVDGHPGTLPGRCRLRCDIRVLPGQERDEVLAVYEEAARRTAAPGTRIEVARYQGGGCQSHRIDPADPIAAALRVAQAATGQPQHNTPFFGGTDARYFARAATPTVVYGPGNLDQAHAPNEYVPERDLLLAADQLTFAARTFLAERPR